MHRTGIVSTTCGVTAVALLVMSLPVSAASSPSAALQPRISTATSAPAVIKTITVGSNPQGVAVDSADDTVYVANYGSNNISVIDGATATVSGTVAVGNNPVGVAVNQADDTIYVTNSFTPFGLAVIDGRAGSVTTVSVGNTPYGVTVNQADDTVYVANSLPRTVSVMNGRTLSVTTIGVGQDPVGVAVNERDDTVYVINLSSNNVSVINGRTGQRTDDTIAVGVSPRGIAVNQADDTVYVANEFSYNVSVINGRTATVTGTVPAGDRPYGLAVNQTDDTVYVANLQSHNVTVINGRAGLRTDDTVSVGQSPFGVAVDDTGTNAGLVFVTNTSSNSVSVIGQVSPTLGSSTGFAGDSMTISLSVPSLAPGFAMDDSTITAVSFGGAAVTGLTAGVGDTWTMSVPPGSGRVPVLVTFKGGTQASAGSYTYATPPPIAPSAPRDVTATAGDASATINWTAPTWPGSFPVTNYRVTSSPGGMTCLTTELTCAVTGLTNGATYTFTVEALSGAGWGATSMPSNAVTPTAPPTPTITITGSRHGQRITVTGTSTHLTSKTVRPWIKYPGQTAYTQGIAVIPVAADGTFTWSRMTGKKVYVYVAHGTTRSNIVHIPAR
jgi:YVTN family beta-propeller protein